MEHANQLEIARVYAENCVPDLATVRSGESAEQIADALLEQFPPDSEIGTDMARDALLRRIAQAPRE